MTKSSANKKRPPLKVSKELLDLANTKGVRNWCFTWNNWTPPDEEFIRSLKPKVTWLVCGREIGDEGTPHLQGAIIFRDQKTFSALNKSTKKKCIWAPMICPERCSDTYCRKEMTEREGFFTFGKRPVTKKEQGKNEEDRWEQIWKDAKASNLEAIPKKDLIRNYGNFKRIAADHVVAPKSLNHLDNEWIYGPHGTGKSFPYEQLRDHRGNCFFKTHDNVWQDYRGEPIVVIDEFEPEHTHMLGLLKQWMGKGVIEAKVLYSGGKFRPKRIIVTSQYHPKVLWPKLHDTNMLGSLYRRMRIYRQTAFNERVFEDSGEETPPTNPEDPEYIFGDDSLIWEG